MVFIFSPFSKPDFNIPYLAQFQNIYSVFGQNILFGPTLVSRTDSGYTQVHPSGQVIRKGVRPDVDSYSAFFDNSKLSKTALEEIIKKELVSDIYVCGIATDVCVGKKIVCCLFVSKIFPLL